MFTIEKGTAANRDKYDRHNQDRVKDNTRKMSDGIDRKQQNLIDEP